MDRLFRRKVSIITLTFIWLPCSTGVTILTCWGNSRLLALARWLTHSVSTLTRYALSGDKMKFLVNAIWFNIIAKFVFDASMNPSNAIYYLDALWFATWPLPKQTVETYKQGGDRTPAAASDCCLRDTRDPELTAAPQECVLQDFCECDGRRPINLRLNRGRKGKATQDSEERMKTEHIRGCFT